MTHKVVATGKMIVDIGCTIVATTMVVAAGYVVVKEIPKIANKICEVLDDPKFKEELRRYAEEERKYRQR